MQIPLLLAYNQHGEGHYDSIQVSNSDDSAIRSESRQQVNTIKCSCGRNDKIQHFRCGPNSPTSSSSRCPCLKAKNRCSSSCSCKKCCNPFGMVTRDKWQPQRKRKKYDLVLKAKNSAKLLLERQHHVNSGPWSTMEHFVLEAVIER